MMTKTPDEIKKGLECCSSIANCADGCPYHVTVEGSFGCEEMGCEDGLLPDALALIQQLEFKNGELLEIVEMLKAEIEEYEKSGDKCCFESQCNAELNKLEALCKRLMDEKAQLEAERDAMKEALGLMVYQYCVSGTELDHRYMCAGETAFRVLGLEQYGDTRTLESWLFPECQEPEA